MKTNRSILGLMAAAAMTAVCSAADAHPAVPERIAALMSRAPKSPDAAFSVGDYYLNSAIWDYTRADPTEFDYAIEQAVKWLKVAGDGGSAEAQFDLGKLFGPNGDSREDDAASQAWYLKAAQQGYKKAYPPLCGTYRVPALADWQQALVWCAKAAEAGHGDDYFAMGTALENGSDGMAMDVPVALKIYAEAAQYGYPSAMVKLGHVYLDGKLAPQDYAASLAWFQKAAMDAPKDSLNWVAEFYEHGWSRPADMFEAARLYSAAAALGNSDAQAWLDAHPDMTPGVLKARIVDTASLPTNLFAPSDAADAASDSDLYPDRALNDEVESLVVTECRVNAAAGALENCVVITERPPNYGFATATRHLFLRPHKLGPGAAAYDGKIIRLSFKWTPG